MWFVRRRSDDREEANAALRDARKQVRKVERLSDEVNKVSKAAKEFLERNHIGEQLEEIILQYKGNK